MNFFYGFNYAKMGLSKLQKYSLFPGLSMNFFYGFNYAKMGQILV